MISTPARSLAAALLALLAVGCGAPAPPPGTGGTDAKPDACGRGVIVVETDYQSTNVSLLAWDGEVLSASFLSSASTAPGLSAPLTRDVDAPTMLQAGARVAILDRYPAGVLTWAEVKTGSVPAQLSLNAGDLQANPQDYAEIGPRAAYVSRYNPNLKASAGQAPFDLGSDVVIVDPTGPAIIGRIDLSPAMKGEGPEFYPRPNRIVTHGDRAYVLLSAYSASYDASASSRVVSIDTVSNAIVDVTVLDGMHGCGGLSLSPLGGRLAVTCSGTFLSDQASALAEAGLVVLRRSDGALTEEKRLPAKVLGQGAMGFKVAFVDEDRVVLTMLGHDAVSGGSALDDVLLEVDLATSATTELLRSSGEPFTLGDVSCAAGCGVCFSADAGREGGVVHRYTVNDGVLTHDRAIRVEATIGLPPRYIGRF